MKRFIVGECRNQDTLFPESLDDYVREDNPVRVIDVFVDELDLGELGFSGVEPHATGRPAYHPATLLKLYVYGYLNRIQSSRRLEKESQRNIEVMWLTGRLMPDFKTIADFRKDNGDAIRSVCREFVVLCRKLKLFTEAIVAIDGSKFKAVNARDKNFTQAKMKQRMKQVEKSIDRYFKQLDNMDRQQLSEHKDTATQLQDKISKLKETMKSLKKIEVEMLKQPDKQISLTDPDARSMMTGGKGIVGYNVQTAVDTKHHLIVTHEVTNACNDKNQLFSMAKQARLSIEEENLEVLADRGYFKGEEILDCDNADIKVFVPKPLTSSSKAHGRFTKQDFHYLSDSNEYLCPTNKHLQCHFATEEHGKTMHCYWNRAACRECPISSQCTTGKERRIKRVSTEMSLHVLAYNLKRVMNIMGIGALIEAIRA